MFYSDRTFLLAMKESYRNRAAFLLASLRPLHAFLNPLTLPRFISRTLYVFLSLSFHLFLLFFLTLLFPPSRYKIHFIATATTNRYFSFLGTSSQSDKRMTRRLRPACDAINGIYIDAVNYRRVFRTWLQATVHTSRPCVQDARCPCHRVHPATQA